MAPIRVAIVEDDHLFLAAVAAAVGHAQGLQLEWTAGTQAEALQSLRRGAGIEVLLVDLGLPDGSGLEVIRAAAALWQHCNVMVSTAFGDEAHVLQSIEAGASGYLLKDSEPEHIVDEIRSLHAGGSPISPLIARQVLMRFKQGAIPPPAAPGDKEVALSVREREVLQLITKGFTTQEIARLLQVSHHTVLTFVRRIYAKLKVRSRAEAIHEARTLGLL
ncbi:response regulator [Xylophilus sp. ASV27]|uniref:response regulator n=1 Tax=Xylophilus sp. ASV27 TaxID=2795129 RepID=UPI0018EC2565|nr:response regulator transcription factor [Xylophilus sp. ASV27]